MQIARKLSDIKLPPDQQTVLTIGSYDGLHRGHRAIINSLRQAALANNALSALVTFYPRPKAIFAPNHKADYLTTLDEKIALFRKLGLDMVTIIPFTVEFAQTSPRQFVEEIVRALRPLELWVGADFRFGQARRGDVDLLRKLSPDLAFTVKSVDLQSIDSQRISSTQIRASLAKGEVRQAATLLGDYPFLQGEVVRGAQRGRKLGFPTANVAVHQDKLLPLNGVYAVWVHIGTDVYPAVANVGIRPTFQEGQKTIEVHIFDFDKDIYGQHIQVDLVDFLRPEMNFSQLGLEALITQIADDTRQARQILAVEASPSPLKIDVSRSPKYTLDS